MQYEATWATDLSLENKLVLIPPLETELWPILKNTQYLYVRISSCYYLTPHNWLREQGTGFDKMLTDDK